MFDPKRAHWSSLDWLLIAALTAGPFIFFHGAINGYSLIVTGDGLSSLFYKMYAARLAWSGEWPLWSPEIGCGINLWAYPASSILHPTTYFFGFAPPFLFANIFAIGVVSLSLAGMFLFGRLCGLDRFGAVFASICYSFCGFSFSYFNHSINGIGHAAAFTPLLLSAYLYLGEKPGPRRAFIAAMATFLMGAIPQDQIFMYAMVHAGYVTFIGVARGGRDKAARRIIWAGIALAVGAGALSARILPTLELTKVSERVITAAVMNRVFHLNSLSEMLATLFVPEAKKILLDSTFFGLFPIFMAIIGLERIFSSSLVRWALGGFLLGVTGLYWSSFIPADRFIGVPLLGWFHSPPRHLFEVFLWFSILAGMGVTFIISDRGISTLHLIPAVSAVAILVYLYGFPGNSPQISLFNDHLKFSLFPAILIAGVISLPGIVRGAPKPLMLAAVAIIFGTTVSERIFYYGLYVENSYINNGICDMQSPPPVVSFFKGPKIPGTSAPQVYRSIYVGSFHHQTIKKLKNSLAPNFSIMYGLPLIEAKNELLPARLKDFLGESARMGFFLTPEILRRSQTALDLLSTGYVIVPANNSSMQRKNNPDAPAKSIPAVYGSQLALLVRDEKIIISNTDIPEDMELSITANIFPPYKNSVIPALLIQIANHDEIMFEKTLYSIKDVALASSNNRRCDFPVFVRWMPGRGKTSWSKVELKVPQCSGACTLIIKCLMPFGRVSIMEANLAYSNKVISRDLKIFEKYLESVFKYPVVYSDSDVTVFKRPSAFSRQWLTGRISIMAPKKVLGEIRKSSSEKDSKVDFMETSLVEDIALRQFEKELNSTTIDERSDIIRTIDKPNVISARVSSPTPVFAVFSEAWDIGWKATLDGKPVPIYRTDYYLRGVAVPAGEHIIEMTYMPAGLGTGLILSVLSLIAMFLLVIVKERKVAQAEGL